MCLTYLCSSLRTLHLRVAFMHFVVSVSGIASLLIVFRRHICSGVLGGIRGYTVYTNLRGFFDSVYSPQRS